MQDNAVSYYKINGNDFLMCEDNFSSDKFFVINDRKMFAASEKEIVEDYFNTVYKVFLERLKKFKELECKVSPTEEKSLTNMFKTLIDAQKMLCGKEDKID